MDILLIHQSNEKKEMLKFNLEGQLNATIHWAETSTQALDWLLDETPIDLLICQDNEDATRILKYILSVNLYIPYVLIGTQTTRSMDAFPDLKKIGFISSIESTHELTRIIKTAIQNGEILPAKSDLDYTRIATELLLRVIPLQADIYIRLSKIKYVCIFKKGRTFTREDAEKYLDKKKIEYLYIKRSDVQNFISHFQKNLTESIHREQFSATEAGDMAVAIQDTVQQLNAQLGFTPEIQQMAKDGVDLTLKSIGQSPSLKQIFSRLSDKSQTLLARHAISTAHVACALAAQLEWPSETTFHKLSLAGFFHDITVKDSRLLPFLTLQELEQSSLNLSKEEIAQFKNHPLEAAQLMQKMKEVPSDVDVILAEHHERPDGSGFPRGMTSAHIAPLAAVFIVAQDLVHFIDRGLIHEGYDCFVKTFGYNKEYCTGTFKKILNNLDLPKKPS